MFKMNKVYSSVRCVRAKSFRKFIRRLLSLAVVSRSGAKRGQIYTTRSRKRQGWGKCGVYLTNTGCNTVAKIENDFFKAAKHCGTSVLELLMRKTPCTDKLFFPRPF